MLPCAASPSWRPVVPPLGSAFTTVTFWETGLLVGLEVLRSGNRLCTSHMCMISGWGLTLCPQRRCQQKAKVVVVSRMQGVLEKLQILLCKIRISPLRLKPSGSDDDGPPYSVRLFKTGSKEGLTKFRSDDDAVVLLLHADEASGLTLNCARHILLIDLLPSALEQQVCVPPDATRGR